MKARALLFALLGAVALVGTLSVYGRTASYGFVYDDYHFVRPHTQADLARAWAGSWDATGIERPFYRPLTTAFLAARFEAFGINAAPYRWLTLGLFSAAALLFGILVLKVSSSVPASVLAVGWFCSYPTFAYSLTGWVMHQMHLLEMILVMTSLLWWWHCKSLPFRWWLPLLVLQVAVMLVKEDGVMLTPAILAVHVIYQVMIDRGVPHPPRIFIAGSIAAVLGFFILRSILLGGMGGYGVPGWAEMRQNFMLGLERVFFQVPARRPGQPFVSLVVRVLPLLAAWPLTRASNRRFAFLGAAGAATAVLFNAPFVFVSRPEQYHLVGLGACLVSVACAAALASAFKPRWAAALVWACAFALSPALARVAIHAVTDFAPCSARTLHTNAIVRDWETVPAEIRAVLATTEKSCDPGGANPADLPVVVFGAWGGEDDHGVPVRWTSGRVTMLVKPAATPMVVPIRAVLGPLGGAPARVVATSNGRRLWEAVLSDERWHCPTVPVGPVSASWLRRSSVVELEVSPRWVPAKVFQGSADTRELGVRLGTVGAACPG
jgi:hypothetical protein